MRLAGHKSNLRLLRRRPWTFVRAYRWPLLAAALGTALDAVTTYRSLTLHGEASELHLAVRLVTAVVGVPVGVPLAMVVKTACAITVAAVWRGLCPWILLVFGLAGLVGAASNHFHLL